MIVPRRRGLRRGIGAVGDCNAWDSFGNCTSVETLDYGPTLRQLIPEGSSVAVALPGSTAFSVNWLYVALGLGAVLVFGMVTGGRRR